MGWGDEIMASGQARLLNEKHRVPVLINDERGRPRKHDAFLYNPRLIERMLPGKPFVTLLNAPGARPYIANKTARQWTWREWKPPVGEIYFAPLELEWAESCVEPDIIIEANIKGSASPNKRWPIARWNMLVHELVRRGYRVYQLGVNGTQVAEGAVHIPTPSMRLAAAVVRRARLVITHEGGMHHTSAALGVPTIVLFGGFISPKQTGYECQTNLFTGTEPCGMRIPCGHCDHAMKKISVEEVLDHALSMLKEHTIA